MVVCNTTLENEYIVEEPLWGNVTFHTLGLGISATFGLISIIISLYLIMQHALHYLKPNEQKYIMRILVMVPIYSFVSCLSYLYYRETVYFQVIRDCYEAFAIASFFTLLCSYIAPSLHDQKDYFRTISVKNWLLGVFWMQKCTGGEHKGPFRKPRSGLTWFNLIWVGIFQYCFIRIFFTVISVITEAAGVYCLDSDNPAFAHIWVEAFEAAAVSIAMFMVVQFYIQLKDTLSEHKPFLKVLSIKLVIFFSFWQTTLISFLSSHGPLKATKKISYPDIAVGLPSMLLCIEMAGFAVLHCFAYPWKPYSIKHSYSDPLTEPGTGFSGDMPKYQGGPFGYKALLDAMNPWDIIKASARGFRWLFLGYKHRTNDISYQSTKLGGSDTGYLGPTYAGNHEAATELRPSGRQAGMGGRSSHDAELYNTVEDDRAGLLHNSQFPPSIRESSPYRTSTNDEYFTGDDSHLDVPMPSHPPRTASPASAIGLDMKPSDYEDEDTGYHPGMAPPASIPTGYRGDVHPAFRNSRPEESWHRQSDSLGESHALDRPPPPYPTDEPHR